MSADLCESPARYTYGSEWNSGTQIYTSRTPELDRRVKAQPRPVSYNPAVLTRSLGAPWWLQAVIAVAIAFAAFGLTLFLQLQDRPFLLPMIGVLYIAHRSGLAAGLICSLVTLALANYYITPPAGQFEVPTLREAYELIVFGLTATIISVLAARGRDARLTLEATVASIGDGVIVTDPNGRVTFLNNVAEHLTGWSVGAADGEPVGTVFNVIRGDT